MNVFEQLYFENEMYFIRKYKILKYTCSQNICNYALRKTPLFEEILLVRENWKCIRN